MLNFEQSPYYDDFNPAKLYYKMLAHPGRAEQAREFTQVQSMFLHMLKGIGDALLQDGSIIRGCSISISADKRTITISDGEIYAGGIVHPVKATTLSVSGTGRETIGVKLVESVVTFVEDPTLKDPAQGYDNYGQSGADRLKIEAKIVANDTQAYTMYTLDEGSLLVNRTTSEVNTYTELLAKRTYDESENYKVRGLSVSVEPDTSDYAKAVVSAGKAYVMGYEINKPAPSTIKIPICTDTRTTTNESKGYTEGVNKYSLNNKHVKSVASVYGQVLKTSYVTRQGFLGGMDRLPNTEVYDIHAINQGGIWNSITGTFTGGTTYTKNVDFILTDNCVDWSPAAEEPDRQPSLGSSYQVAFKYTKNFVEFKDYKITSDDTGRAYVNFGFDNGDTPVNESLFMVTYDWYLERTDLLTLTKTGDFRVLTGQPDKQGNSIAPESNLYELPLATLKLPPNSNQFSIVNHDITRVTMRDLNNLLKRVSTIEYNLSISNLDKEAEAGEPATELKGILTDGFIGFTKADVTHPDFNAAINFFTKEVGIPSESTVVSPEISMVASSFSRAGRLSTLPYTEQLGISQPYATGVMNINPYQVFSDSAQVLLSPDTDTWIDETNMQLPVSISTESSVTVPPKFIDEWWTTDSQRQFMGSTTETTETTNDALKFFEQAITFMRPIKVTANGSKFKPGDELKAKFAGVPVNLHPIDKCTVGSKEGTIKVGSEGIFVAEFTIPKNITTGTKLLTVYSDSCYSEAAFTSQGIQRMFMSATVSHTNVVKTYQDLVGTNNKLVSNIANEALDLATQNRDEINNLKNELVEVEGRLTTVEEQVKSIGDNVAELDREYQRQLKRIEENIDEVASESGKSIEYIQANMEKVASELMATKQQALEAQMKSDIAKAIAEQAQLEAASANRLSDIALAKASSAEIIAQTAALNAEEALAISQQAMSNSDEATRAAANAQLIANTALTEVRDAKQVAQYALSVANSLQGEISNLEQTARAHDNQLKEMGAQLTQQQAAIGSLASQAADAAAERQQLRQQIAAQNNMINGIRSQVNSNTANISSNASRISTLESQMNALGNYYSLSWNGSSWSQRWIDPLAQSFGFTKDTCVTGVEVAFGNKGTLPITCQIRKMSEGGQPTIDALATKVLYPTEVNVSEDGSVLTKVDFDTPAYCEANTQYCFVFITEDTQYTLYTATMGEKDLITQEVVNKQPYSVGVLFSSSNNVSWTVHQTLDLKFNLYVMNTEATGTIEFEPVSNILANQVVLAADQLTPSNTRIDWEITTDKAENGQTPIKAYNAVSLPDVTTKVKLKANLRGVSGNTVSPMIVTDTLGLSNMLKELKGTYLSKLVTLSQPYSEVKQVIDANLPSGTALKMYFSPDDGATWIQATKDDNLTEQVSLYFSRYTFLSKLVRKEPSMKNSRATSVASGGSLPCAKTLYYMVTGVNSNGETTGKIFSVTTSGATGTTGASVTLDLTDVFDTGLSGFKVYRGESASNLSLKYVAKELSKTFVDTGADTDAAIDTPPTENTATYTSSSFRAKFVLETDNHVSQPKVKRFVNIMK